MKLSETENVYPVELTIEESVVSNALYLNIKRGYVALDQTTAAELLPILQHFIATGELPERNTHSTRLLTHVTIS